MQPRLLAAWWLVGICGALALPAGAEPVEVSLRARWHAAGELIDEPLFWRVHEAIPGALGERVLRASEVGAAPVVTLEPGPYVASAVIGRVSRDLAFEVGTQPGPPVEVVFDAGILLLGGRRGDSPAPIDHSVSWRVLRAEDADDATPVVLDFARAPRLVLPTGRYRVIAVDGVARTRGVTEVRPGETTVHTAIFAAGEVRASAALVAGGPRIQQSLQWRVWPAGQENEEPLISEYRAAPVFRLPVGAYRVEARFGDATAGADFEVASGEPQSLQLALDAGLLRLSAALRAGGAAPGRALDVTVLRDDEVVARVEGEDEPLFTLNAGSYEVRVAAGLAEVTQPVSVAAGGIQDVEIDLGAGRIEAEGVLDAAPPPGALLWRLFRVRSTWDRGQRPIATLEGDVAVFVLPEGIYRLVASDARTRGERIFQVKPGRVGRIQVELEAPAPGSASRTSRERPPRD